MREVAVHLEDELGAVGERAAEAGDVGGPEALLALAVEHVDVGELGREAVGELAGAVGRVVVDHEHAHVRAASSARSIGSRFSASL